LNICQISAFLEENSEKYKYKNTNDSLAFYDIAVLEIYTSIPALDNILIRCIIIISAHGASCIWIPVRVADTQPAGVIPDAVAGNGDAEKRVPACINGSNEPSIPCRALASQSWPLV